MSGARLALYALIIAVLAVAVRLPALAFPMGPEAGKIAYVGQHWMRGGLPYRDAWDHQGPGLYLVSGLSVALFGPSAMACRLAMAVFAAGTILLVYGFVRQWGNRDEAAMAAGLYGFFSGAQVIRGDCLTAGPPLTFCLVLAVLAALRADRKGSRAWLLACGLAAGAAVCIQPLALLYLALLMLWVGATGGGRWSGLRRWAGRPGLVALGALLPVGGCVAYFAAHGQGALVALWRGAVLFNLWYDWFPVEPRFWRSSLQVLRSVAPEQGALWLFAAGWVLHAFSQGFRRETGLVALWIVAAVVAAALGRRVYPTDLYQTVVPLAVGAALAVTNPSEPFVQRDAKGRIETRSLMLLLFAIALAAGFIYTQRRAYLATGARSEASTDIAAEKVARIVRERTEPGEPIYVWGTRPQIYVLAGRPAAHRYFYNRPLNIPKYVEEYFGEDVFGEITATLKQVEPRFFVTTEEYVLEERDLPRLGAMAFWFQYLRRTYDLPNDWIIDARPYPFAIFVLPEGRGAQ